MVEDSLDDKRSGNPGFFVRNILCPYYKFLDMDIRFEQITSECEERIFQTFEEAFDAKGSSVLQGFVTAWHGKHGKVELQDRAHAFNTILRTNNFHVMVRPAFPPMVLQIVSNLDVSTRELDNILFCKNIGLSAETPYLGTASLRYNYMLIYEDGVNSRTQSMFRLLYQPSKVTTEFEEKDEILWKKMGLDLSYREANDIIRQLYLQRLRGLRNQELGIRRCVRHMVAVHEAKHRWDLFHRPLDLSKLGLEDRIRRRFDVEVSGDLTEIIYSRIPFAELESLIFELIRAYNGVERVAGMQKTGMQKKGYSGISPNFEAEMKAIIFPILREAWACARGMVDGTMDEDELRDRMRVVYKNYRSAVSGEPLPDLEGFEQEIVRQLDVLLEGAPAWREKLTIGLFAACVEVLQVLNPFKFLIDHENKTWQDWTFRTAGIAGIWLAMYYAGTALFSLLMGSLGLPMESAFFVSVISAIFIANPLAHGVYNILAFSLGFAPLVKDEKRKKDKKKIQRRKPKGKPARARAKPVVAETRPIEIAEVSPGLMGILEEILDLREAETRSFERWKSLNTGLVDYFEIKLMADREHPRPNDYEKEAYRVAIKGTKTNWGEIEKYERDCDTRVQTIQRCKKSDPLEAAQQTRVQEHNINVLVYSYSYFASTLLRALERLRYDADLPEPSAPDFIDNTYPWEEYIERCRNFFFEVSRGQGYAFIPGWDIMGFMTKEDEGVLLSPIGMKSFLIARRIGCSPRFMAVPHLANELATNEVVKVEYIEPIDREESPPGLALFFRNRVKVPHVSDEAVDRVNAIAVFLLRKDWGEFSSGDIEQELARVEFDENDEIVRPLAFSEGAPQSEKLQKTEELLDLALKNLVVARGPYVVAEPEGARMFADFYGRDDNEVETIYRQMMMYVMTMIKRRLDKSKEKDRLYAGTEETKNLIRRRFNTRRLFTLLEAPELAEDHAMADRAQVIYETGAELVPLVTMDAFGVLFHLCFLRPGGKWLVSNQVFRNVVRSMESVRPALEESASYAREETQPYFTVVANVAAFEALPGLPQSARDNEVQYRNALCTVAAERLNLDSETLNLLISPALEVERFEEEERDLKQAVCETLLVDFEVKIVEDIRDGARELDGAEIEPEKEMPTLRLSSETIREDLDGLSSYVQHTLSPETKYESLVGLRSLAEKGHFRLALTSAQDALGNFEEDEIVKQGLLDFIEKVRLAGMTPEQKRAEELLTDGNPEVQAYLASPDGAGAREFLEALRDGREVRNAPEVYNAMRSLTKYRFGAGNPYKWAGRVMNFAKPLRPNNNTGAGMIPAFRKGLDEKAARKRQAVYEELLTWGATFTLLPHLGIWWSLGIVWLGFLALHFIPVKGMPRPPTRLILLVTGINIFFQLPLLLVPLNPALALTLLLVGFTISSILHQALNIIHLRDVSPTPKSLPAKGLQTQPLQIGQDAEGKLKKVTSQPISPVTVPAEEENDRRRVMSAGFTDKEADLIDKIWKAETLVKKKEISDELQKALEESNPDGFQAIEIDLHSVLRAYIDRGVEEKLPEEIDASIRHLVYLSKASARHAIDNLARRGGDEGTLILRLRISKDKKAIFQFILLDNGEGFDLPIHEAVRDRKSAPPGERKHGYDHISDEATGLLITTANRAGGKHCWEKGMPEQVRLRECPVDHGTKVLFTRDLDLQPAQLGEMFSGAGMIPTQDLQTQPLQIDQDAEREAFDVTIGPRISESPPYAEDLETLGQAVTALVALMPEEGPEVIRRYADGFRACLEEALPAELLRNRINSLIANFSDDMKEHPQEFVKLKLYLQEVYLAASRMRRYADIKDRIREECMYENAVEAGISYDENEVDRIIGAMRDNDRRKFIPPYAVMAAYVDEAMWIDAPSSSISAPSVVAFMTYLLGDARRVCEVGTATGYQAAVLSGIGKEVCTVEISHELAESARKRLSQLGHENVIVIEGDGTVELERLKAAGRTFDGIIVTAGAFRGGVPEEFLDLLEVGGRIVIPVGKSPDKGRLMLGIKEEGGMQWHDFGPIEFVPLMGKKGKIIPIDLPPTGAGRIPILAKALETGLAQRYLGINWARRKLGDRWARCWQELLQAGIEGALFFGLPAIILPHLPVLWQGAVILAFGLAFLGPHSNRLINFIAKTLTGRTINLPNAPPWKSVVAISLMHTLALAALPLSAAFFNISILSAAIIAFIITTLVHYIANIETTGSKAGSSWRRFGIRRLIYAMTLVAMMMLPVNTYLHKYHCSPGTPHAVACARSANYVRFLREVEEYYQIPPELIDIHFMIADEMDFQDDEAIKTVMADAEKRFGKGNLESSLTYGQGMGPAYKNMLGVIFKGDEWDHALYYLDKENAKLILLFDNYGSIYDDEFTEKTVEEERTLLQSGDPDARLRALFIISEILKRRRSYDVPFEALSGPETDCLIEFLDGTPPDDIRVRALKVLSCGRTERAVPHLIDALKYKESPGVQRHAAEQLERMCGGLSEDDPARQELVDALIKILEAEKVKSSENSRLRWQAERLLRILGETPKAGSVKSTGVSGIIRAVILFLSGLGALGMAGKKRGKPRRKRARQKKEPDKRQVFRDLLSETVDTADDMIRGDEVTYAESKTVFLNTQHEEEAEHVLASKEVDLYRRMVKALLEENDTFVLETLKSQGMDENQRQRFTNEKREKAEATYTAEGDKTRLYKVVLHEGDDTAEFVVVMGQRSCEEERNGPRKRYIYNTITDLTETLEGEYKDLQLMHDAAPDNTPCPFYYSTVSAAGFPEHSAYSTSYLAGYEGAYLEKIEGELRVSSARGESDGWAMTQAEDVRKFLRDAFKIQIQFWQAHGRVFYIAFDSGDVLRCPLDDAKPIVMACAQFSKEGDKADLVRTFLVAPQVDHMIEMPKPHREGVGPIPVQEVLQALRDALAGLYPGSGAQEYEAWFKAYCEKYDPQPGWDTAVLPDAADDAYSHLGVGFRETVGGIYAILSELLGSGQLIIPPAKKPDATDDDDGDEESPPTGAGMIPALRKLLGKEEARKKQAFIEQGIGWGLNTLIWYLGGGIIGSILTTWGLFVALHYIIRTKNMPHAPPFHRILGIALINALALGCVLSLPAFLPTLIASPTLVFIASLSANIILFGLTTAWHQVWNLKHLRDVSPSGKSLPAQDLQTQPLQIGQDAEGGDTPVGKLPKLQWLGMQVLTWLRVTWRRNVPIADMARLMRARSGRDIRAVGPFLVGIVSFVGALALGYCAYEVCDTSILAGIALGICAWLSLAYGVANVNTAIEIWVWLRAHGLKSPIARYRDGKPEYIKRDGSYTENLSESIVGALNRPRAIKRIPALFVSILAIPKNIITEHENQHGRNEEFAKRILPDKIREKIPPPIRFIGWVIFAIVDEILALFLAPLLILILKDARRTLVRDMRLVTREPLKPSDFMHPTEGIETLFPPAYKEIITRRLTEGLPFEDPHLMEEDLVLARISEVLEIIGKELGWFSSVFATLASTGGLSDATRQELHRIEEEARRLSDRILDQADSVRQDLTQGHLENLRNLIDPLRELANSAEEVQTTFDYEPFLSTLGVTRSKFGALVEWLNSFVPLTYEQLMSAQTENDIRALIFTPDYSNTLGTVIYVLEVGDNPWNPNVMTPERIALYENACSRVSDVITLVSGKLKELVQGFDSATQIEGLSNELQAGLNVLVIGSLAGTASELDDLAGDFREGISAAKLEGLKSSSAQLEAVCESTLAQLPDMLENELLPGHVGEYNQCETSLGHLAAASATLALIANSLSNLVPGEEDAAEPTLYELIGNDDIRQEVASTLIPPGSIPENIPIWPPVREHIDNGRHGRAILDNPLDEGIKTLIACMASENSLMRMNVLDSLVLILAVDEEAIRSRIAEVTLEINGREETVMSQLVRNLDRSSHVVPCLSSLGVLQSALSTRHDGIASAIANTEVEMDDGRTETVCSILTRYLTSGKTEICREAEGSIQLMAALQDEALNQRMAEATLTVDGEEQTMISLLLKNMARRHNVIGHTVLNIFDTFAGDTESPIMDKIASTTVTIDGREETLATMLMRYFSQDNVDLSRNGALSVFGRYIKSGNQEVQAQFVQAARSGIKIDGTEKNLPGLLKGCFGSSNPEICARAFSLLLKSRDSFRRDYRAIRKKLAEGVVFGPHGNEGINFILRGLASGDMGTIARVHAFLIDLAATKDPVLYKMLARARVIIPGIIAKQSLRQLLVYGTESDDEEISTCSTQILKRLESSGVFKYEEPSPDYDWGLFFKKPILRGAVLGELFKVGGPLAIMGLFDELPDIYLLPLLVLFALGYLLLHKKHIKDMIFPVIACCAGIVLVAFFVNNPLLGIGLAILTHAVLSGFVRFLRRHDLMVGYPMPGWREPITFEALEQTAGIEEFLAEEDRPDVQTTLRELFAYGRDLDLAYRDAPHRERMIGRLSEMLLVFSERFEELQGLFERFSGEVSVQDHAEYLRSLSTISQGCSLRLRDLSQDLTRGLRRGQLNELTAIIVIVNAMYTQATERAIHAMADLFRRNEDSARLFAERITDPAVPLARLTEIRNLLNSSDVPVNEGEITVGDIQEAIRVSSILLLLPPESPQMIRELVQIGTSLDLDTVASEQAEAIIRIRDIVMCSARVLHGPARRCEEIISTSRGMLHHRAVGLQTEVTHAINRLVALAREWPTGLTREQFVELGRIADLAGRIMNEHPLLSNRSVAALRRIDPNYAFILGQAHGSLEFVRLACRQLSDLGLGAIRDVSPPPKSLPAEELQTQPLQTATLLKRAWDILLKHVGEEAFKVGIPLVIYYWFDPPDLVFGIVIGVCVWLFIMAHTAFCGGEVKDTLKALPAPIVVAGFGMMFSIIYINNPWMALALSLGSHLGTNIIVFFLRLLGIDLKYAMISPEEEEDDSAKFIYRHPKNTEEMTKLIHTMDDLLDSFSELMIPLDDAYRDRWDLPRDENPVSRLAALRDDLMDFIEYLREQTSPETRDEPKILFDRLFNLIDMLHTFDEAMDEGYPHLISEEALERVKDDYDRLSSGILNAMNSIDIISDEMETQSLIRRIWRFFVDIKRGFFGPSKPTLTTPHTRERAIAFYKRILGRLMNVNYYSPPTTIIFPHIKPLLFE